MHNHPCQERTILPQELQGRSWKYDAVHCSSATAHWLFPPNLMVSWRFTNSGISGVGLYTSFGAHINPRYYSFGESTWDLVFFIGTGALGPLGSWQTFLLAVVNVLMQVPSGRLTWRAPRWQYPVGEPSQKINFCGLPRLLDLDCWSPIIERCRKNLRWC